MKEPTDPNLLLSSWDIQVVEVLHSIPTFTVATAGFRFTIHASTWLIGWEIISISGTTLGSWDSEIASNNVSPLWTNQDFMRCDFWSCVFFSWLIVFFGPHVFFGTDDDRYPSPPSTGWFLDVFFFGGGESLTWQTAAAGMIPYIMGT